MWGVSTKNARPVTLRRSFARSTGPLLGLAGFTLAFLAFTALWPEPETPPVGREVSESAGPSSDEVERLIRKNDCWTGEAPPEFAGQLPGHVVVTLPGAEQPRLGGDHLVGQALEHVFEGRHPRLQVHAFCP